MDKASNSVMIDDVCSAIIYTNRKIHSLVDYIKSIDEDKFDDSVVTKIERGVFEILMDGVYHDKYEKISNKSYGRIYP